ncbi:uncharacterized protein LOC144904302 isoform X2 [Branchiostoma floridae x Branchiostoma belcheri]
MPPNLFNRPRNRNGWYCPSATADVLTKNSWNYVGATYDHVTGKAAVWHDGAEVGSIDVGSIELATQREIRVGSLLWGSSFSGRMSCLQLYDYVLGENEFAVARRKCEGTCPYGWHPAGYVCYRLFHETVNWETADARCREEGGRLASVKNEDTHKFLAALKNMEDRDSHVWIGLHDCLSCFNLALQKTAFQTSTHSAFGGPSNAVDDNTDGNYHSTSSPCMHSLMDISNPSWWVDLGQWYRIDRVVIFNRRDCCSGRINPFNIHIGDSDQVAANPKCGGDHHIGVNQPSISVPCQGMWGRYVGVRLPGSSRTLHLCEVQVFSVADDPQAEWMWADGTPLSQQDFRRWTSYSPDRTEEHCVWYWAWRDQSWRNHWEDVLCSRIHKFFCERVNPPENLTCSSTTTNSFEVHWLYTELYPDTPLSGYRVWYRHVLDDIYTEPTEVTNPPPVAEATSVAFSGLKSGSMYSVSIHALVGTAQSLDVMVQCITETDVPVLLACANATLSSVAVSWISPQAPLVGYRANYILIDQDNPTTITTELGSGNQSHIHQGAVADREYHVTLVAVGMYKDSLPVDITCATMTPPPEDFEVTSITGTSAKVSWVPSTSPIAIGYKVWIRQSGSADTIHTYHPQLSQNEVTFQNLIPATEYTILATTINMYIEGTEVNLTVATETHPPLALDVDYKTTDTVVISWLPPRGLIIEYSINYTGNRIMTSQVTPGDVTRCELTGLIPGMLYDIDVVAVSRFGRSIAVSTNVLTGSPIRTTKETYDEAVTTTTRTTGSLQGQSTSSTLTTQTVTPVADHAGIFSTPQAKTTDEQILHMLQDVESGVLDNARPEEILSELTNVNEIIRADASLAMPPSVMLSTTTLMEKLVDASRGAQGMTVRNVEAMTNVLVETASTVLSMLPEGETPTTADVENLLQSNLVDLNSGNFSPKQQLRMMKDRQQEKEETQQQAAVNIVTSLDNIADTLLALQPEDTEYQATFTTRDVAVTVSRSMLNENLRLNSGQTAVTIVRTSNDNQTSNMLDVRMSVFEKNPYSWKQSTGGQNISSPVTFLSVKGSESKDLQINLDFPLASDFSRHGRRKRRSPPHTNSKVLHKMASSDNGTNMTYHVFNFPNDDTIPIIQMTWWDVEFIFHVYSMYGSRPTADKYAEKRVVQEDWIEAWYTETTNFTVSFTPNTTDRSGDLYIGVNEIGNVDRLSETARGQPKEPPNYRLTVSAFGCSSWNDKEEQWKLANCNAEVDLDKTVACCQCRMAGSSIAVGTMTLPVPNAINFMNAFKNFRNVSDNAVVFSIVVSELILYVILMILLCVDFGRIKARVHTALRRSHTTRVGPVSVVAQNERKMLSEVSLIPPDRMPAPHEYQLTVTTGSMLGAGTTSRVAFQLFGSEGTTSVKMLNPRGEFLLHL